MDVAVKLKRKVFMALYYLIGIHLPSNRIPFMGFCNKIRSFIVSQSIIKSGKNNKINKGVLISENLKLGDNVVINEGVRIRKGCSIGSFVELAPGVTLLTQNHEFNDINVPITNQGVSELKGIVIEDDVWVGTNAIVLPGITLSKGTVIGAGSVVTKDFPKYSVVAGNPARLIRIRGQ